MLKSMMLKSPMNVNRELNFNDTALFLNLHRKVNDSTGTMLNENKRKASDSFAAQPSVTVANNFMSATKSNIRNDTTDEFNDLVTDKKTRET